MLRRLEVTNLNMNFQMAKFRVEMETWVLLKAQCDESELPNALTGSTNRQHLLLWAGDKAFALRLQ